MAREKGSILAWDEHWLFLLNRTGIRQAQRRMPGPICTACCADDGSAYVAIGKEGGIWWLAPDLSERKRQSSRGSPRSAALDPYGNYLAVAGARGDLELFDRNGRLVSKAETPRPLHHLVYVPEAPFLLGCADFGLVCCFDWSGRSVWQDGLVSHIGSLAVNSDGNQVVLACFGEGIQRYDLKGTKKGRLHLAEPCRLASISFDGKWILVASLTNLLVLSDLKGGNLGEHRFTRPAAAIVLGPLGDHAVAALSNGQVVGLSLRDGVTV
jgi:WD40 repeat protein